MAAWGAHPSRARAKDNDKDKDKCGRGWGAEVGVGGEAGPWGLGQVGAAMGTWAGGGGQAAGGGGHSQLFIFGFVFFLSRSVLIVNYTF